MIDSSQPWSQSGRVSLWRYTENTKNYGGWHLNADAAGCRSLAALLRELASGGSPTRSVRLTSPTVAELAVPNNRDADWLAPNKLRVGWSATPSDWCLPPSLDPAELTFGSDWLEPLLTGVAGIAQGKGDYSIGSRGGGSLPLWFWW